MNNEASAEEILAAKKKVLRLLEFSDRTEKQLRDKLAEEEFSSPAIDEAIAYAYSFHYIDDRRYAENFLKSRESAKSRYEIHQELMKRGVPSDVISEVMDENEIDEKEAVVRQFIKKYGRKDLSDPSVYEKAIRYFAGRGYRYDVIKSAVTEAIERMTEEES